MRCEKGAIGIVPGAAGGRARPVHFPTLVVQDQKLGDGQFLLVELGAAASRPPGPPIASRRAPSRASDLPPTGSRRSQTASGSCPSPPSEPYSPVSQWHREASAGRHDEERERYSRHRRGPELHRARSRRAGAEGAFGERQPVQIALVASRTRCSGHSERPRMQAGPIVSFRSAMGKKIWGLLK